MRIALVVTCILGLYVWRLFYCGSTTEATAVSASMVQKQVIQRILDRSQFCICSEIRVSYRIRLNDGFTASHIAHYDSDEKTLRIKPDSGSGWAFGWDGINEQVMRQVLHDGGQFSLFTKYRPAGKYVPGRMQEPF